MFLETKENCSNVPVTHGLKLNLVYPWIEFKLIIQKENKQLLNDTLQRPIFRLFDSALDASSILDDSPTFLFHMLSEW